MAKTLGSTSLLPRPTPLRRGRHLGEALLGVDAARAVDALMVGTGQCDEILRPVIGSIAVDVVNLFTGRHTTAVRPFPHETVFSNVSDPWVRSACFGMVRGVDENVAVMDLTSLEGVMLGTGRGSVVPTCVGHREAGVPPARPIGLRRNPRGLPASAPAHPVEDHIGRGRFAPSRHGRIVFEGSVV